MRVLVACEESQAVANELRRLGHEAYSCDVISCGGGHPEYHLQVDALELLKMKWDMIIAFPPCTYLTSAGAVRLFNKDGSIKDLERYEKGIEAARFFRAFLEADCERIAVENPAQMKCFGLPRYTQHIEPYQFGDPWKKEDIPVAEGIAGAEADKGGGAGGPLGRGNQREQRPGYIHQVQGTFKQRPETESKNISGDSEGHGRAVGRGGVKSAEVKGCTRDAKEGG